MWLEWLALSAVLFFAVIGALRGALASALRILSLALAYAAALLAAPRLGPVLAELTKLPLLLAPAAAGATAFTATLALTGPVSWLLLRRERRRRGERARSAADRLGGALCGVAQGGVIALLLGVLGNWLPLLQARDPAAAPPAPAASPLARTSTAVLERAADWTLPPDARGARLALHAAVRPTETLASMHTLLERPALVQLRDDELFWTYVQTGAVEQALNRGTFLKVSYDPALRAELSRLGLVSPESADSAAAFRQELRGVLAEVGPRIRALKDSGELQRLAQDPALVRAAQSGDTFALLSDPSFRSLVYRALQSAPHGP